MVGSTSIKREGRFAQRENVLLGYSPQRAFPKTDIDFHDVFGGPPRRSSTQDMRCGFTDSTNSSNGTTREEEDSDSNSVLPRNPGCGLSEMPVFGEGNLTSRRYRSDDFFDDIFRGDHSLSTPKRSSDDAFGSTPGSRILSPARSVPSRADSFGGSVTAQLQFRHSSEAFQEEKEFRSAIRPFYRPSFLSSNFSLSSKGGSYMTKSGRLEYSMDTGGKVKKDLKNTEPSSNSSRFHFSIYKWAGEGMSILMAHKGGKSAKQPVERDIKTDICPRSNGRTETVNRANELQTGTWCDSDLHFLNHTISVNNEFPYTEAGKQDKGSVHKTSTEERVELCHIVKEAVLSVPGSETINNIPFFSEREHYDTVLIDKREEIKPHTSSEIGICESTEKEIAMCGKEVERSDLKPLHSLLHDADERQGFDVIIGKHGGNDCIERKSKVSDTNADVSKNVKKHDEEIVSLNGAKEVELKEPHSQNSSRTFGETLEKSSVKGKVKEFVQGTSNPKVDIHTQSQSSRWKSTGNFREDDQGSANTTQTHGNSAHVPSVNKRKSPPNGSSMVDKNGEESEKQQKMDVLPSAQDSRLEQDLRDENSFAREDASASSSKSLATNGNIDDIFLEDFMIEELSDDQDKPLKTEENDYEDIQISDAKIREWSSGKEGNIRSLLSTLQYVLWTGSGWKPVRLVDIIEGSAVKRAYQKALLCLHPDKLQQKGAASHQQYIAETVFAILQEAWDDHFDSLGAI